MKTNTNDAKFQPDLFQIELGEHHGKDVIWLRFPYDVNLIKMLKTYTKARWSASQKAWYLSDNYYNRNLCKLEPKIVGKQVIEKISEHNLQEFYKFQNILILKGFSRNTIRTYSIEFAQLLYLLKDYPVEQLSAEKLQSYFLYCHKELQLSENLIHSRMNAIKFYFEKVLHQDKMFFDIPRPKKPELLPKSLSTKEVLKLFKNIDNPKHKLIIKLCYGMGLRVSEIVNVKLEDIDGENLKVFIHRAKGKKDRMVNLPESVLEEMRDYYKEYRPKVYLFENRFGEQYSTRSIQKIFKNAMKKAKINKTIGVHGLRHSYATHLLEFGTDISLIQKLLGHNDIKTTLSYTKVVDNFMKNVKSPLDRI